MLRFSAKYATSEQGFETVVAFMDAVGKLLRKQVTLSAEDPDRPVLVYTPEADRVQRMKYGDASEPLPP